jgi:HEAT repeat protein
MRAILEDPSASPDLLRAAFDTTDRMVFGGVVPMDALREAVTRSLARPEARSSAIGLLQTIDTPWSVDALASLARDPGEARAAAVDALSRSRHPRAVERLRAFGRSSDAALARVAEAALARQDREGLLGTANAALHAGKVFDREIVERLMGHALYGLVDRALERGLVAAEVKPWLASFTDENASANQQKLLKKVRTRGSR